MADFDAGSGETTEEYAPTPPGNHEPDVFERRMNQPSGFPGGVGEFDLGENEFLSPAEPAGMCQQRTVEAISPPPSYGGDPYADIPRQLSPGIAEDIQLKTEDLVQETIERLGGVHGVLGVVVLDKEGLVVRTSMPAADAARHAIVAHQLLTRARGLVLPGDTLSTLRVRTKKHELVICNERLGAYAVLVVQNPYLVSTDEAINMV
jgi:dynein light chain roadblock-type